MTNVKLKLMFFLLNALLSADVVQARPYSAGNVTDVTIEYSNNSTFSIPVDSNSDTLIVANEEETIEEINKNSDTQMEAIVNAEQGRDEDLTEKIMREQTNVLGIPKDDAMALEQQLNISSPLLDEMMDSESNREESLTDILFKSDSEFVGAPRFEFLIAGEINESDITNRNFTKDSGFSDNNLEKADRNTSDILRKVDYVELVEVLKPSKINENKSAYNLGNITGHEVDNDLAPDTSEYTRAAAQGFTDLQTLFLACLITMLLLFAVFLIMACVMCIYRRCCRSASVSGDSESSDKDDGNHQQLQTSSDDVNVAGSVDGDAPPANGSIFTMTLKNNHLIVETEERNDIAKNGRETKMKYSPDNDGIFVVEVQQSTAYRPNNKTVHNSPPHDPQISTNQALIHRVPEDFEKKMIEEDSERSSMRFDKRALALSSTGLSISDLSMSSIGSHNISYSYSSQMGYEHGPFGYPIYAGYNISKEDVGDAIIHDNSQEPLIGKTPTDPDRPVVTAAIFKQDSIIGNDILQGPGYCIEGSSDGPLLSDVQAREYSLQHLHYQKDKKVENGVAVPISEKVEKAAKSFSRADSLPMRIPEDIILNEVKPMDKIGEDIPKDIPKGKRASLPAIRSDVYESVKEVIQTGSPKFEKFNNDRSPGESSYDSPPMITITEESESGKSDSTS